MNKAMSRKRVNYEKMPVVNMNAAGIDVGSRSHFVAVCQDRALVREFGVYTEDLHLLCRHLVDSGCTAVALESTGSYWQPLFILLQQYGLNPILVNGKYTKNVKGRKTDVIDCMWIQKLHTVGMLEGSYIPDLFTETVRQYYRHRQTLVENAAGYINKMQKALRLINIRLDVVLRDVMGRSGRDIIEAVLAGERDARMLASIVQPGVKAHREEIVAALSGDWREEYVFELRQCYEIYQYYHRKIDECDTAVRKILDEEIKRRQQQENLPKPTVKIKKKKARKNEANINLQQLTVDLTGGVDLSAIEGVGLGTILCLVAETGLDMKTFPTANHFSSWLNVAPDLRKTGGKVINRGRTRPGKGRLARALMHAANAVGNMKKGGYLVAFFKRIARKSGRAVAITATANKLSKIIWNMLTHKQPYQPVQPQQYLDKLRAKEIKHIKRKIRQFNISEDELIFVTT
jgi:transposase